ncbi:transposon Tf2-9 polyprotein [Trichonephila clavipes]|nr:transposon Tf2-9 polyprotein [Trichonephila clavipes]
MPFQSNLPLNPCRFCECQGIQNAYHWAQTCPFRLSAIQVPPQIPMQPNVDPLIEESQISQLLEISGYIKKKPLPGILDTDSTISIISHHFVSSHKVYETPDPSVERNSRISVAAERICDMPGIFQNVRNSTQHRCQAFLTIADCNLEHLL